MSKKVVRFLTLVESSSCAVPLAAQPVFLVGDNGRAIYRIPAAESAETPEIRTEAGDYLLLAQKNMIGIYDTSSLKLLASTTLTGKEDVEVQGLSVSQEEIITCVYLSRNMGKQYLFIETKTAEYLQIELSCIDNVLHMALVRNFTGSARSQVKG
ncbi:phytase [Apiospora hydei]|uniref:Phytase n=1 Tax=Apiospora hydei TaxID=1337664 RepID=A0ABR1WS11_9PEZI